jgi:hypothetical protein
VIVPPKLCEDKMICCLEFLFIIYTDQREMKPKPVPGAHTMHEL